MAGLDRHVAEERVQQCGLAGADAAHHSHNFARLDLEAGDRELEAVALVAIELQDGVLDVDAGLLLGEDGVFVAVEGGVGVGVGVQQEVLDALERGASLCTAAEALST